MPRPARSPHPAAGGGEPRCHSAQIKGAELRSEPGSHTPPPGKGSKYVPVGGRVRGVGASCEATHVSRGCKRAGRQARVHMQQGSPCMPASMRLKPPNWRWGWRGIGMRKAGGWARGGGEVRRTRVRRDQAVRRTEHRVIAGMGGHSVSLGSWCKTACTQRMPKSKSGPQICRVHDEDIPYHHL